MSENTTKSSDIELPEGGRVLWHTIYHEKVYPLSRPRFSNGHTYQPLENQKALRAHIFAIQPETPIETLVWLDCHFFALTRFRADLDNLVKAVCDGLQHSGVLANDRQVVGGTFLMGLSDEEYSTIIVREANFHVYRTRIPE